MKTPKRHTVTSALPYVNGPIHFGHLAGCYLPADIYVRYLRSMRKEVLFICGSDENGMAITLRALKEGVAPEDIVNKYHPLVKESFKKLGISFDHYSRTTSDTHFETAQEFFRNIDSKGILKQESSKQLYDAKHQQFLADRYVKGECPKCGAPEAYGDQCENCGSSLNANDLINPVSTLSGEKPVVKETRHWYFPLNEYQEWLEEWILEEHKNWKGHVYGQCKSWLDGGLQPRAVTRDLSWGVPVPREDAEGKKLYVWFDAPIGYISSTKEWAAANNTDWEKWWKDEETELVHFIGKDNIVFHCIFFPAMLKAHGDFVLPENVPANEFLNLEGSKFSTSKNYAVWLHEFLEEVPGHEDVLRYVLTANMPENKDADFSWKDYQTRNNTELTDIIGNLVNRVLVLTHKNFDGALPVKANLDDIDKSKLEQLSELPGKIGKAIENYRFKEALNELMNIGRLGNKYLTETEPWKTAKNDEERTGTILNIGAQIIGALAICAEPFIPFTAKKLQAALGLENAHWQQAGASDLVVEGAHLKKIRHLFSRIPDEFVEKRKAMLEANKKENETVETKPIKDTIAFEDFTKLDLRVGTITEAEKMPKTKKLLKLTVDLGAEKRTVVSGIAEHYSAEEVVGQQVSLLANLAPRKLRGVESEGMILMAEDSDGVLRFVGPDAKTQEGSGIA